MGGDPWRRCNSREHDPCHRRARKARDGKIICPEGPAAAKAGVTSRLTLVLGVRDERLVLPPPDAVASI
jgi:hypothetical protein